MILEVFNRYRDRGGEEVAADIIFEQGSKVVPMDQLRWNSSDWDKDKGGPGKLGQLRRLFYNPDTVREFREKAAKIRADAAMFHNIFPVGSAGLYKAALDMDLPVIQYIHNFRPFSVSGTLWTGKRVAEGSMRGNYWEEVRSGSWQGSVLKSAIFSLVLRRLHKSGWLAAVKRWIAISDFMRGKFIEAGIAAEHVVTLKHPWAAMESPPGWRDEGYYLCLARLLPAKGVTTLLEAWMRMEKEWGNKCPRLVVAGMGPCADEVERAAERSESIDYVGFVEGREKSDLIAACRAMMVPSVWWEPLGLVTYEAYDYGKPMIAAASGGLTETVEEGVTGFLHGPADVDGVMNVVRTMEAKPEGERREMGARGRDWLLRETNPEQWKREFKKIVSPFVR